MDFWLHQDQFESLRERYRRLGVPMAEQIRRAIDEYLDRHGKLGPQERNNAKTSEKSNH